MVNNKRVFINRILLLSICLFVFSCSDDQDNVTLADLEGDWIPVSECIFYTGECPPMDEFEDECVEYGAEDTYYIHIEDGVISDFFDGVDYCEEEQTITITGNIATFCDVDNECVTGTIELTGNTLSYSVSETGYEDYPTCSYELVLTATRL